MDDVVVPWTFRGTRSLTHSLTHSILINVFITFFPDTKDGFCINGNILNNTDNIICKKWTWNCLKDVEIIERGSLLYIWMNCTYLFPILLDMERM